MKAIVCTKYGPPEVLQIKEVEKPVPGDYEILIKVHASSVNPLDWHTMRGKPFIARMAAGILKPKYNILGADVAGRIEAAGKNVRQFQPGDEVFGDLFPNGSGAFAEYVCVPENAALVMKPAGLTFEEAAAVPCAAVSALQGIIDKGHIKSGQRVLINGASGGVGTFAVQIAKSFGIEVTGVCSTRNLEMVSSIGADKVVDYTKEDFTKRGQQYELIIDNVGNRSVSDYKRALSPGGICVIIGYTSLFLLFQHMFLGPLQSTAGKLTSGKAGKKIGLMGAAKTNRKDLDYIKELIIAGKVKPVIDKRYKLDEVPEAICYLEKGHARGKVVITMEHTE
jgi:NADPH:quinone reductase-like Zn-dependent oxidoreductase